MRGCEPGARQAEMVAATPSAAYDSSIRFPMPRRNLMAKKKARA
jgi:hypothetical protein